MQKLFVLIVALLSFFTVRLVALAQTDQLKNLSFLENGDSIHSGENTYERDADGAIIRINPEKQNIYFVFTVDSLFEGGEQIFEILKEHQVKASFFFTGNFLRNREHKRIIKKIIKDGHYIGPHSDKYVLYCDRKNRDSTIISFEAFKTDLENNIKELERFEIQPKNVKFFVPPYELYNREIVNWGKMLGFELINFTPGTGTNDDIITPEMKNYKSSEKIWEELIDFEQYQPEHLNGAILLIHPGTDPARKDKFYYLLEDMIEYFYTNGYRFSSLKN